MICRNGFGGGASGDIGELPYPVSNFKAYQIEGATASELKIRMTWDLPERTDALSRINIVRNTTATPESPTDGDVVELAPTATQYEMVVPTVGTYYFRAFAMNSDEQGQTAKSGTSDSINVVVGSERWTERSLFTGLNMGVNNISAMVIVRDHMLYLIVRDYMRTSVSETFPLGILSASSATGYLSVFSHNLDTGEENFLWSEKVLSKEIGVCGISDDVIFVIAMQSNAPSNGSVSVVALDDGSEIVPEQLFALPNMSYYLSRSVYKTALATFEYAPLGLLIALPNSSSATQGAFVWLRADKATKKVTSSGVLAPTSDYTTQDLAKLPAAGFIMPDKQIVVRDALGIYDPVSNHRVISFNSTISARYATCAVVQMGCVYSSDFGITGGTGYTNTGTIDIYDMENNEFAEIQCPEIFEGMYLNTIAFYEKMILVFSIDQQTQYLTLRQYGFQPI